MREVKRLVNTVEGTHPPIVIHTSTMGRFKNRVALFVANREVLEFSRERLKSDFELAMY